ncbi:hypothetical protein DE146DRAFT_792817 [Phaeosphaeria sp. MPI-PUGE-AT-0046c]|nr:hypothetical protein DE146DRAFT_792817 [Phaeosphaeria sp. MPI-PUGE-AT-0046c]
MPVFNLGCLGRFKVQCMQDDDAPLLPITEPREPGSLGCSLIVPPPPAYSLLPPIQANPRPTVSSRWQEEWEVRETEWYSSVSAPRPNCRIMQLRRYLMELVALNVQADFGVLNAALYGEDRYASSSSILSPDERTELLGLCKYAQQLHNQFKSSRTIHQLDLGRYQQDILKPYLTLCMSGSPFFALDLFVWHAEIFPRRIPWFEANNAFPEVVDGATYVPRNYTQLQRTKMMQGLDVLIRRLSLNEQVRLELTQALNRCNSRIGFDEIRPVLHAGSVRTGVLMLVWENEEWWLEGRDPGCVERINSTGWKERSWREALEDCAITGNTI